MSELPLASLGPMAVLIAAVILNMIFCSEGMVNRAFATPTALAGRAIRTLESRYNKPYSTETMRRADSLSVAVVLILTGLLAGVAAELLAARVPFAWLVEAMLIATFLIPRSHFDRSRILRAALDRNTEEARATLSWITGRDATGLDKDGLIRAGVESSAMSLAQGFIAPVLWYSLLGLPGLLVFKLIDIASIMIDEQSDHARSFGWAPRKISAALIAPAALLCVPLVAIAALFVSGADARRTLRAAAPEGRYAWPVFTRPVAAFAHALGIHLGGSVCIGSFERSGDTLGGAERAPESEDICRARRLFLLSCTLAATLIFILAFYGVGQPLSAF